MEQTRHVKALDHVADLLTENGELRARIAALQSQLAQYRWRRVEDGMPDGPHGIDVLVWNGDAQFIAYTMLCGDGKVRWVDTSSQDYEAGITHWMPLPPAPQDGK